MRVTAHNFGWTHAGTAALVLGAIAACSSASSSGREGNLGHGVFLYQCDTDQDPACAAGSKTLPGCEVNPVSIPTGTQCFPSEVAVGGRFRLQYSPNTNTNVGNPVLKVVSQDFMNGLGDGQFRANRPGTVGIYTQSTVDSTLVDYTLLKISAIKKVQIQDVTGKRGVGATVTMTKLATAQYKLLAQDQNGQSLAGAVDSFLWETSDPTIVTLATDAHSASIQITAAAVGKATISAYADDTKTIKASFDVTVQ